MIVQLDSGEPRALSANYVANHLRHAYPLTARGAQGATVHWARVIGRPREFRREWGYAAAIPLVAIALAANLEPPAWQLAPTGRASDGRPRHSHRPSASTQLPRDRGGDAVVGAAERALGVVLVSVCQNQAWT
jgi:hypothetical protein